MFGARGNDDDDINKQCCWHELPVHEEREKYRSNIFKTIFYRYDQSRAPVSRIYSALFDRFNDKDFNQLLSTQNTARTGVGTTRVVHTVTIIVDTTCKIRTCITQAMQSVLYSGYAVYVRMCHTHQFLFCDLREM